MERDELRWLQSQENINHRKASTSYLQGPGEPRRCHSVASKSRYPLIDEGEVRLCRISNHKPVLKRVFNLRLFKKWETHQLVLSDENFFSPSPHGYMKYGVAYSQIDEVQTFSKNGLVYCIHVNVPCFGAVIMEFRNTYFRDQWFNSLVWKMTACRFKNLYKKIEAPNDLLKELKELIEFCQTTPITDTIVTQLPLNSVSELILKHGKNLSKELVSECLKIISPLLECTFLTPSVCKCFEKMTQQHQDINIAECFLPSVQRILKHNTDFTKLPHLRMFVQKYLCSIYNYKKSENDMQDFIDVLHTPNDICPHQRMLPNLVTLALACIFSLYEDNTDEEDNQTLFHCIQLVFKSVLRHQDWIVPFAVLLQAVPFPKESLKDERFRNTLAEVIQAFAEDKRCEVHQCILPIRDEKDGWVHLFAPGGVCCNDDGEFFAKVMSYLISCCCKRKKMLMALKSSMKGLFELMAIRGDRNCVEVLIAMLEFDLMLTDDEKLEVITALQSSNEGRDQYEELCRKRTKFLEMKEATGPSKLTLPSQSSDEDLFHVLGSGSFGNLQSLNLAFTRITSDAAEYIIKLPNLQHLNLWATPFDDRGLQLISEHLVNLQSLNLCETAVTDEGLKALSLLKNLRILNLNSTKLSALTYEYLKEELRELKVVDLRYTEAY